MQRAGNYALANVFDQSPFDRDIPIFALQIIGRLAAPDIEDLIDRLDEHGIAVGVEIAEDLRVGQQSARAYSKYEAAIEHMIEHGHGCRDRRRMAVRQVDRAGPKLDLLGRRCEPGNERDAGGDVFGLVGGMLPDIRFGKAELIRQQEGFPILAERLDRKSVV